MMIGFEVVVLRCKELIDFALDSGLGKNAYVNQMEY